VRGFAGDDNDCDAKTILAEFIERQPAAGGRRFHKSAGRGAVSETVAESVIG
jgi:hypothetical protein